MLWRILNNCDLSLRDRLKNVLYYISRVRGAKISWNNRHNRVSNSNVHLNNRCDPEIEGEHTKLWKDFRNKTDLTTLRICKNLSGIADPRMVPEDIFVSDIEPTLITDKSVQYIAIKSFYNHWFPIGLFPEDLFHKIDGQYYTDELEKSDFEALKNISQKLTYPVILKPNKDTYGATDIHFVNSSGTLLKLAKQRANFVIQKKIKQHDYFNHLYPHSLNSIKVNLYRSVSDNSLNILSMALRMGKDGSLDNESVGGIATLVNSNGYLNGFAIDKLGKKFIEHPNTKMKFDFQIPEFKELKKISLLAGEKVFYTRLFSFDACFDYKGQWRLIELNTRGQSIRFSQYGGQPFFGKFTDEVIEYCKKNHWALH